MRILDPDFRKTIVDSARREDGSISVLNVFIVVMMCIFAGIAIDMASLVQARTQLQVTADAAAHAAIMTRDHNSAATARTKALEVADVNMPSSTYGTILQSTNVHFGNYDVGTRTFSIDENSRLAVYVQTTRLSDLANPLTSFLLQFVGIPTFDVVATAVYTSSIPCPGDGWMARNTVDAQSNNNFLDDFCIYSDTGVELNQSNDFELGTKVIMQNGRSDLTVPGDDTSGNPGLEEAIGEDFMPLAILDNTDLIVNNLTNSDSRFHRDYLTSSTYTAPVGYSGGDYVPANFPSGGMYEITCSGGSTARFDGVFRDVVIKSSCPIAFRNGGALENMVLINTSTDVDSITGTNGFRMGVDDGCDPANAVQMILSGGLKMPANFEIFGSQIIAQKRVDMSAQASGVQGGSVISGDYTDGTSLTDMSGCPNDDTFAFQIPEYILRG